MLAMSRVTGNVALVGSNMKKSKAEKRLNGIGNSEEFLKRRDDLTRKLAKVGKVSKKQRIEALEERVEGLTANLVRSVSRIATL